MEPVLHFLEVPGPAAKEGGRRRLAWWDWTPPVGARSGHVVVCVHGLTRQARDFDVLARALSSQVRVVAVDVAGRGRSDWLQDPMAYQVPSYVADLAVLLGHLREQHALAHPDAPPLIIDWVGTSMGGLIGMALASIPAMGIRRLVLNDVGPVIEHASLRRIGAYVGQSPLFPTEAAAVAFLREVGQSFGPHTDDEWLALSRPMLRSQTDGWTLHYDPDIAIPFKALMVPPEHPSTDTDSPESAADELLWQLYDSIVAKTLVLRGAESDLLSRATVQAMAERGPRARVLEFAGVGHAPTLVHAEQVAAVRDFLLEP